MEYRFLGDTGVKVSSLCMGTMTFGREADRETSAAMFHMCRDAGVNFFDCADAYGAGESERILGELISDCREEVIITSKAYFPTGTDMNSRGLSRRHLLDSVEASLRRLATDRIDIYFLHHFDAHTCIDDTLRALDDLVTQGKVLYVGASNFAAWQIMKMLNISSLKDLVPVKCIQPMYNLLKRQAEVELLPMAESENLGVTTYSPLAGGLLSGKYHESGFKGPRRMDSDSVYKLRYRKDLDSESAARFRDFAVDSGYNPVSLAVAWVGHNPVVTSPIIGARNIHQLKSSLSSVNINMTEDLYNTLSRMFPSPPPATDRDEENAGVMYTPPES